MSRNRRSLELPLTEDCGLPRAPARTDSEPEARSKPSGHPSRMSFDNRSGELVWDEMGSAASVCRSALRRWVVFRYWAPGGLARAACQPSGFLNWHHDSFQRRGGYERIEY